jgi:hypothetical protein
LSLQQKGITTLKDGYLYEKEGKLYSIKIDASKDNFSTENNIIYFQSENISDNFDNYYENDAGILYANALYGVKIIIKNCNIDSLGNFNIYDNSSFVTEYRWLWTNRLLNSNYNSI